MVERAEKEQKARDAYAKLGKWKSLKSLKVDSILGILDSEYSGKTHYMIGVITELINEINALEEKGKELDPVSSTLFLNAMKEKEDYSADVMGDILKILCGLKDGLVSIENKINKINKRLDKLEIGLDDIEINMGEKDDFK